MVGDLTYRLLLPVGYLLPTLVTRTESLSPSCRIYTRVNVGDYAVSLYHIPPVVAPPEHEHENESKHESLDCLLYSSHGRKERSLHTSLLVVSLTPRWRGVAFPPLGYLLSLEFLDESANEMVGVLQAPDHRCAKHRVVTALV